MFRKILKFFAPIIIVAGIYTQGPDIETNLFPVIGGATVHNIIRTDTHVCYTMSFTKLRYAIADYAVILANDGYNTKYDTVTIDMSTGQPLKTFVDSPVTEVGVATTKTYCSMLPSNKKDLTLTFKVKYITWHKQWDLYQQFPSVPVPDQ